MAHDGRLSFVFIKNIKRCHTTRLKIIMSIRFFNVQKDTLFNEKYVTLSEKHILGAYGHFQTYHKKFSYRENDCR